MAFGCVCASPRHTFCNLHGKITAEKRERARPGLDPVPEKEGSVNTDLVVQHQPRQTVALSNEQVKYIAHTEFVPKQMRGNLPAILACIAAGRELGIGDMAALKHINIIDGSPSYSAELCVLLVRNAGHSIVGNFSPESCTATGRRADNGDEMSVTWTMEMAKRAGLANKNNWKYYPEAMLWARAVTQLCRMLFADCFAGGTYTEEELGGDSLEDDALAAEPDTLEHPEGVPVDDGKFPPLPDVDMPAPKVISEAQRKRLRAIQNERGVSDDALKAIVLEVGGVESSKLIPVARYEAIVAAVEAVGAGHPEAAGFQLPPSMREQP